MMAVLSTAGLEPDIDFCYWSMKYYSYSIATLLSSRVAEGDWAVLAAERTDQEWRKVLKSGGAISIA